MKRLMNKTVFGLMLVALTALASVAVVAQDEEKTTLYTNFTGCYKGRESVEKVDACIAIGKDYLTKFGTKAPDEPDAYTKFITAQIANLEKWKAAKPLIDAYAEWSEGFKTKNPQMIFSGGKKIISLEEKNSIKLDRTLVLVTTGYDAAFAATPNTALIPETIAQARSAIRMMESGVSTEPQKCGEGANAPLESTWGGCLGYGYGSKENATAWMNFMIARLISDTNKDQTKTRTVLKEAAPYYYKALQTNVSIPKDPSYKGVKEFQKEMAYNAIGRYYLEEYNTAVEQWNTSCKAAADDPKATETDDCKRLIGMQKAYAELAADASARAYNAVSATDPKMKSYRDNLLTRTTKLYEFRFKKTDGVNDFISKAVAKPLADPNAPVNPIIEETPVAATEPAKPATTPATNGTKPVTTPAKPATTPATNTKPANTPAKPAGSGKGTVAKGAAKKKTGR